MGIVRSVREAIDAGRQQAGNDAGRKRSRLLASSSMPNITAAIVPSAVGRDQAFSGLGRKIIGAGKLPCRCRKLVADRVPCRFGRENDGDRRSGRRGLEQ